jgi:SAM-dependent methyltransferase
MNAEEWAEHLRRQSGWTGDIRRFLYEKARLPLMRDVLEIGCGTGLITAELKESVTGRAVGLDCDQKKLTIAEKNFSSTEFIKGEAESLPFSNESFDGVFFHFFFLWAGEPLKVLREAYRVLRPGGRAVALAEPDYGAWIDEPEELSRIGELTRKSLLAEGANPFIGRELGRRFREAGFSSEVLVFPALREVRPGTFDEEWALNRKLWEDLASPEELEDLQKAEEKAFSESRRLMYYPIFSCIGRK